MSISKNRLQDIFELGSTKLGELAHTQHNDLHASIKAHLLETGSIESLGTDKLQEPLNVFKAAIEKQLERSIQRIHEVIDSETQETGMYLKQANSSLSCETDRLRNTIDEIHKAYKAKLDVLSEDIGELCSQEFESASAHIQKQEITSEKNLNAQCVFLSNSFQQKLDNALLETRGEERQISSKLFKLLLQSITTIDSRLSSLQQQLADTFQSQTEDEKSKFEDGLIKLNAQIDVLVTEADTHTKDVYQKIQETYASELLEYKTTCEQVRTSSLAELKELEESSIFNLAGLGEELPKNLDTVFQSATHNLEPKSTAIRQQIESGCELLNSECARQLSSSLLFEQDLEDTINNILSKIRQDLVATQNSFEARLNVLTTTATDRLTSIVTKAGSSITASKDKSTSELESIANKAISQIEDTVLALLARIEQRRRSALEEIDKAATREMSESKIDPAPEAKRTKKSQQSGSARAGNGTANKPSSTTPVSDGQTVTGETLGGKES